MTTRFFKFPDMLTAFALAQQHGMTYTDENGEPWLKRYTHDWAIDVVGEIEIPAVLDEEGNVVTPASKLEGWHINVRTGMELPPDFSQYEVFPATPARDFA